MVKEFHPQTEADGRSSFEVEAETRRKCSRSCWRGWAASSPKSKSKPNLSSRLSQAKRQVIYMPVAELSNVTVQSSPAKSDATRETKPPQNVTALVETHPKQRNHPYQLPKRINFWLCIGKSITSLSNRGILSHRTMQCRGLDCIVCMVVIFSRSQGILVPYFNCL